MRGTRDDRVVRAGSPEDEGLRRLVELTRGTLSDEATREHWPVDESGLRRLERPNRGRVRLRWQAVSALGFAALLMVAAPAAWFAVRSPGPLTFEVINGTVGEKGEIRPATAETAGTRIRFSDGSEIALDPEARAQVSNVTPVGARIVLSNGRAHTFFVPKPHARWQVAAGPYVVQVTGTIFDVQWSGDSEAFDVWLEKGSVRVSGPLIGDGIAMTHGQHLLTRVKDNKILLDSQRADAAEPTPATPEVAPAPAAEPAAGRGEATGTADEQDDDATPPSHIPARVTHPVAKSWSRRMARGDFEAVVAAAERRGIRIGAGAWLARGAGRAGGRRPLHAPQPAGRAGAERRAPTISRDRRGAGGVVLPGQPGRGWRRSFGRRLLVRTLPARGRRRHLRCAGAGAQDVDREPARLVVGGDRRRRVSASVSFGLVRGRGQAHTEAMMLARAALRGRGRRVAGAGALLAALTLAATVRAESARRVVLVVPEAPGAVATEALARVRGELGAARFEVETDVVANNVDRRATVERALRKADARAAFGIFFGSGVAEIWVSDSVSGRTVVQTLPLSSAAPERRATVLAVKAVDLLKATLAEVWLPAPVSPTAPIPVATESRPPLESHPPAESRSQPEPPAPPPSPPVAAEQAPAPRAEPAPAPPELVRRSRNTPGGQQAPSRSQFEVAAGGAWIGTPGAGAGWAPMLTFGWFRSRFGGRLAVSGFGTNAPFGDANLGGSAHATNTVGIVELVVRQALGASFDVNAALGAGAYRFAVEGLANPGYSASSAVGYSAVGGGGVGATAMRGPVFIALDAPRAGDRRHADCRRRPAGGRSRRTPARLDRGFVGCALVRVVAVLSLVAMATTACSRVVTVVTPDAEPHGPWRATRRTRIPGWSTTTW